MHARMQNTITHDLHKRAHNHTKIKQINTKDSHKH